MKLMNWGPLDVAVSDDWRYATAAAMVVLVGAHVALRLYHQRLANASTKDAKSAVTHPLRPKGTLPLFDNTFQLLANIDDPHGWYLKLLEESDGKPVMFKLLGCPKTLVVATPEAFEDVLKTHFDNFEKGEIMNEVQRDLIGEGIFAVDGAKWYYQRKVASNLFTMRKLRDSMTTSVQTHTVVLNKLLQRAALAGEPIDIVSFIVRFTMDTFGEIGFGVDLKCLETPSDQPFQEAFDNAQRVITQRFTRPRWFWKLQRWLNVGLEAELKRDVRVIDDMMYEIIAQSLANRKSKTRKGVDTETVDSSSSNDIISLFLDTTIDNDGADVSSGDEFNPKLLRDIVLSFLMAGRDTTCEAISWLLYCLMQNPEAEKKIRQELADKLPELMQADGIEVPSMEQSQELVYLEAALRESLRLFPSVPTNMRRAKEDVVLSDGTFVKAGWTVGLPPYAMARLPQIWGPDAKEFRPERWIDPETGKLLSFSTYKYNVFNAGPRTCLGISLAIMEVKIVAASLLSRFHFDLVPGQNITYELSLTLPVKGAMMVNVFPAAQ